MKKFCCIQREPQSYPRFSVFNEALFSELPYLYNDYVLNHLKSITLIHDESSEINAFYNPANQSICITSGLMEYLWLLSYLHYDLYLQTPWGNSQIEFDFSTQPVQIEYNQSHLEIINRMRSVLKRKNAVDWPTGVTPPTYPYDVNDNTTESKASELMLYSLAVIILHELGHHVSFVNNFHLPHNAEEMFADWFAYTQFVDLASTNYLGAAHYDNAIRKRFFASINVGCFLLNSNLAHGHGAIHPDGISRLDAIIAHNSNILHLSDDRLYNRREDKCDMRMVISYAAFLICVSSQLWIDDNDIFVSKNQNALSTTVFESPFYAYKKMRAELSHYVEWKEQTINERAFGAARDIILSQITR